LGPSSLTILPEAFRFVAEYRLVIFGLAILVTMHVRPQGIAGSTMLSLRYREVKKKDDAVDDVKETGGIAS
jgi:hypothetical protein